MKRVPHVGTLSVVNPEDVDYTLEPDCRSHDISKCQYGWLLAIRCVGKYKVRRPNRNAEIWLCRCKCGATIEVEKRRLTGGYTKSCGCALLCRCDDNRIHHKRCPLEGHNDNG